MPVKQPRRPGPTFSHLRKEHFVTQIYLTYEHLHPSKDPQDYLD